jgi:hypothetical protein
MITLFVCSRLGLPLGHGLLAAIVGLAEIGVLTYLFSWALRRWGAASAISVRQLEATLLTTFTVAMLGLGS